MNNSKLKIGEQIKKFRIRKGLTQNDLAKKIGLTEKQISKIETGVHYPMFENFVKIMDVLGVQLKDFDCSLDTKASNVIINNIVKTLNKASDVELKYYSAIIKQLEKMFSDIRKSK